MFYVTFVLCCQPLCDNSNECKLNKDKFNIKNAIFFFFFEGTTEAKELFTGINFVDMEDNCVRKTEDQIKKEITASLKYLSMAAYFSKDNINRPGFAKFFFDAASEEREHAYKLIEYLSMRGRYLRNKNGAVSKPNIDISNLLKDAKNLSVMGVTLVDLNTAEEAKSTAGLIALQNALKLETAVTKSIRELIITCETETIKSEGIDVAKNDYHVSRLPNLNLTFNLHNFPSQFVDYLTGEFLEEQYKGQRDLAGKIATLGKMVNDHEAELADFLFDKQL